MEVMPRDCFSTANSSCVTQHTWSSVRFQQEAEMASPSHQEKDVAPTASRSTSDTVVRQGKGDDGNETQVIKADASGNEAQQGNAIAERTSLRNDRRDPPLASESEASTEAKARPDQNGLTNAEPRNNHGSGQSELKADVDKGLEGLESALVEVDPSRQMAVSGPKAAGAEDEMTRSQVEVIHQATNMILHLHEQNQQMRTLMQHLSLVVHQHYHQQLVEQGELAILQPTQSSVSTTK